MTQRRLGFAMEEGARGGHRSGHVVVVLALDADEVEEVALAARYVVSPCPPQDSGLLRRRLLGSLSTRCGRNACQNNFAVEQPKRSFRARFSVKPLGPGGMQTFSHERKFGNRILRRWMAKSGRSGVEPTLVSPAAKFVMQGPSERSCRGQNGRRGSRGSRSTASQAA